MLAVEHVGDDEAQHAVAQKLEALVGLRDTALAGSDGAGMGQRAIAAGRGRRSLWPSRASSLRAPCSCALMSGCA